MSNRAILALYERYRDDDHVDHVVVERLLDGVTWQSLGANVEERQAAYNILGYSSAARLGFKFGKQGAKRNRIRLEAATCD